MYSFCIYWFIYVSILLRRLDCSNCLWIRSTNEWWETKVLDSDRTMKLVTICWITTSFSSHRLSIFRMVSNNISYISSGFSAPIIKSYKNNQLAIPYAATTARSRERIDSLANRTIWEHIYSINWFLYAASTQNAIHHKYTFHILRKREYEIRTEHPSFNTVLTVLFCCIDRNTVSTIGSVLIFVSSNAILKNWRRIYELKHIQQGTSIHALVLFYHQ